MQNNNLEKYSTHNEKNPVITQRFIRTLKNKICKYMTSISKNVYIDKLDDIAKRYDSTNHSTIKMKPFDVKSSGYINSTKEINDQDPKSKFNHIVRISKYQNIFVKVYAANLSGEDFVIKKVKNTVPWTYVISHLKGEEIVGTFHEKEL